MKNLEHCKVFAKGHEISMKFEVIRYKIFRTNNNKVRFHGA